MTRRRWDRFFLTAFVVAGVIGAGLCWLGSEPRRLGPLLTLPPALWAFLRWQTPREGEYSRTIAGTPGMIPLLWWLGIWGGVGLGGFLILNALVPLPEARGAAVPIGSIQIWAGFGLAWFVVLATVGDQIERRYKKGKAADDSPLE